MSNDLRSRCFNFLVEIDIDGMLDGKYPTDELLEFVVAETGRSAEPKLDKTLPLVCYFASDEDREEFIAAVLEANPTMVTKKLS